MKSFHVLLSLIFVCGDGLAFQSRVPKHERHCTDDMFTKSNRSFVLHAKSSPTGEFELQELKVQIDSMKRQNVSLRSLAPTKRLELESYARAVVENELTPVDQVGQRLPGTKWRLAFSTENSALSGLPSDATVYLDFADNKNMDYSLVFGEKTTGLKKLTAKSTWTAGEGSNPGLVSMVYDKITCDAFGLSNLGVGFFGLLKGRASYIQTAYFDDDLWIDGGYAADGSVYFSVYTKEH